MARKDFPELSAAEYKSFKRALSEVGHSEDEVIRKRKARHSVNQFIADFPQPARKPRANPGRVTDAMVQEAYREAHAYHANHGAGRFPVDDRAHALALQFEAQKVRKPRADWSNRTASESRLIAALRAGGHSDEAIAIHLKAARKPRARKNPNQRTAYQDVSRPWVVFDKPIGGSPIAFFADETDAELFAKNYADKHNKAVYIEKAFRK